MGALAVRDNQPVSGIEFLDAATRQAEVALDPSRPWPAPERPWASAETRERGALAHWPVPADELARLVPPELRLERFEGRAWLGVAAFRVGYRRARGLPPLPVVSALRRLEVRTYVTDGACPGIWLVSLELSNRVAVETAKRMYRLPAYHAAVELEESLRSLLVEASREGLAFRARYEVPQREAAAPVPGSFAAFVCERYALYTADGGRLYRAETHSSRARVVEAAASLEESSLVPVELDGRPRALLAERQDTVVWSLEELG